MNILSIGNSFSADAHQYLHRIAAADGVVLNTFNLYIGGCPLSKHYRNMLSGERAYLLQMNGVSTGFYVTLKEALLNRDWDVVTFQQASHVSTKYDRYQPYLNKLVEYVRECVPKAKLFFHETWAYEQDSLKLTETAGYTDQKAMYLDIAAAARQAAQDMEADGLIPCGTVFQKLLEKGVEKVHRDTFHASLGLGRYALGLTWYRTLTGNSVAENTFADFDEPVSPEEMALAKACVAEVTEK